MALTREEVLHVAKLARVGLTDDEVTRYQQQLSQIFNHFEVLASIDTEGVPPTTHTLQLHSVMSADEARPSPTQREILANAPMEQDGYFRVRAVLEE